MQKPSPTLDAETLAAFARLPKQKQRAILADMLRDLAASELERTGPDARQLRQACNPAMRPPDECN